MGMASQAYKNSHAARSVFDEADDVLGYRFSDLIMNGPPDLLTRTENAQPAIFCVSIALLRSAQEHFGVQSDFRNVNFMAGHSLGEYTALVAADALDFSSGLRLVKKRGELMQVAADETPSSLLAILALELDKVKRVCNETGAQISNVNNPGQVVIGGPLEVLEHAKKLALEIGARRVMALDVNGAFHTEVMRPAQAGMDDMLRGTSFRLPKVPLIGNTTALPITTEEAIREELGKQLCNCVWWQHSMAYIVNHDVQRFVEIGPGNVLSGIVKRINPDVETISVGDLDSLAGIKMF